jgi:pimeloyl-ACP methyl ester carboxylesterase
MTGEEVRDLGYLKWRDPWAWMETMKGKRWEALISREKRHFNSLASQPHVEKETRQMEKEILLAQQYSILPGFKIGCGTINIIISPSAKFYWRWVWNKSSKPAYDIDVQGNIVWYVTSDEDKHFRNQLICESSDGKHIWKKSAVSSQIAIIGELCYYIKVLDYFTTSELCVCNAQTGNSNRVLYRETDKRRDIVLIKGANRTLYLKSEDPVDTRIYKVVGQELIPLAKTSMLQMPLGESIYGDDCILTRNSHYEAWSARGKPVEDWILPDEEIEWANIQSGHILTMHEGAQTIWFCAPRKKPHKLFKIKVGSIEPNIWARWESLLIQSFIVKSPFGVPCMVHIINTKVLLEENPRLKIGKQIKFAPLDVHRFHTPSADGTSVPYIVIKEKGVVKPKAQLVYVYGGYGSSTPISWPYHNWYPLLKRKWALVYALVRGGGDIDAAWAEMARRDNRHLSVDDFEAVISDAQKKLKLGPEQTVIYGRSAGGVPVGAIVSRHPDGRLVGAAFTEVPYVDVLRTSSNPDLPLTIGEYDEFGNPLERIQNFKELLSVSPINTLPTDGAPGVFVIDRVGLLDRQVFAYESFKWIQKLRGFASEEESDTGAPKGKYITFERAEAHQTRPHKFPRFRAIDLAILDSWVDGKLRI